jgi:hypothetical protein
MKKDFIVSKIEAPQDGSHNMLVAFTDPNALKSTGGGGSGEAVPFTSPEDLMKNLPKAMSNMFCLNLRLSVRFRLIWLRHHRIWLRHHRSC